MHRDIGVGDLGFGHAMDCVHTHLTIAKA